MPAPRIVSTAAFRVRSAKHGHGVGSLGVSPRSAASVLVSLCYVLCSVIQFRVN